jgi:hypothetical protein
MNGGMNLGIDPPTPKLLEHARYLFLKDLQQENIEDDISHDQKHDGMVREHTIEERPWFLFLNVSNTVVEFKQASAFVFVPVVKDNAPTTNHTPRVDISILINTNIFWIVKDQARPTTRTRKLVAKRVGRYVGPFFGFE